MWSCLPWKVLIRIVIFLTLRVSFSDFSYWKIVWNVFAFGINPFIASQLSTTNFSLYYTYKTDIWWWENENWSNKANYWRLKVKFSQICSMKSMGSGWENLKIQLALGSWAAGTLCLLIASVVMLDELMETKYLNLTLSTIKIQVSEKHGISFFLRIYWSRMISTDGIRTKAIPTQGLHYLCLIRGDPWGTPMSMICCPGYDFQVRMNESWKHLSGTGKKILQYLQTV